MWLCIWQTTLCRRGSCCASQSTGGSHHLLCSQADPDLAFYLEEAFEQLSPRTGALQPSAAGTDLLGMNLEEELTEEEELVTITAVTLRLDHVQTLGLCSRHRRQNCHHAAKVLCSIITA